MLSMSMLNSFELDVFTYTFSTVVVNEFLELISGCYPVT